MVSQAVTAREQNVRRIGALHSLEPPALDGFAVGAPTSPQCGDLNASERQPHVEEQPASILNLQTSTPPHPGTKEPQGSRKKAPPGPLAHIRPSFAPFCVDTSPETFQTFLGLLRDIRTARGLTSRSTLDKASRFTEGNCTRSYAVNATTNAGCKSQLKEVCPNLTGRVGEVRPEDNPCGDSHPGGCPAPANRSELGAASSTVQLEVLRCALRLLRINLFYFVRAASIRRAYHGENGGADNGDPLKEDDVDTSALDDHRMAPDDAEESASNDGGNRANRVILRSNQALGADRNVRGDSGASLPPPAKIFQGTSRVMETRVGASAEGGVVGMLPAPQATISEGSQHAEYESTKNKDGDIEVFIQEIHRELWKLLEEATEGHSPEIAEAIEAVHVRFETFLRSIIFAISADVLAQ